MVHVSHSSISTDLFTFVLFALGINYILCFLIFSFALSFTARFFPTATRVTPSRLLALFAALLAVAPSLYAPSPDMAKDGVFSNWFLLWYLPSPPLDWHDQTKLPFVVSFYPPVPWLAHTLWGAAVGHAVSKAKWGALKVSALNLV